MAMRERDVQLRSRRFDVTVDGNGNGTGNEAPVGELLKRLGEDTSTLVKQEITLAKLELRESMKGLAKDAGKMGAAAGLGLFGGFALLAFVIVGLGDLINNYWLSALIVAVLLLGAAAMLAKGAMNHMKDNSLAPEETVQTLKEDQRWAQREVQQFKQSMKS
jgi:uncharacterized membrane protein YqjE